MDKELFYHRYLFRSLRAFCTVVDLGSFSNAAVELQTSQPAISREIQQLEKYLNVILFERKGPSIEITPDGTYLYGMSKPLIDSINQVPEFFFNRHQELHYGDLEIIGGDTALLNILPAILKKFAHQYPKIRIITRSTIARDIPKIILANEADFAIGTLFDDNDELLYYPIYQFPAQLIMPLDHPLMALADEEIDLPMIAKYGLITPPEYSYTWWAINFAFEEHNIKCPIQFVVSNSEATKRYVREGLGIAIVMNEFAMDYDNIRSVSMEHLFPTRKYGLIQRRGKYLTLQALRFKELFLSTASSLDYKDDL